jgi:MFS family permease
MDEKIEKVIALAGNEHRYQYFTLAVIVFLWINCNFIAIVIPYLEREPVVRYSDRHGNHTETLTNEICDEIKKFHRRHHYEIVEKYDYSWVSEYKIECDKVEVGLIGSFAFIGNTAGGLIFSFITKILSHKNILIISSIGFCIAVFLCTIIKSHAYFLCLLICEVFIGLFGNCLCYSSLVVAQEIVSNEKRSLFSSIINVGYSLCGVLYSLAFLFAKDWRIVFYILILASFIALILIWVYIYDSPRGYINKNDYRNTIYILEGIAYFNGKLDEFRESIKQDEYKEIFDTIKWNKNNEIDNNKNKESEIEGNINDSRNPDISGSLLSQDKSSFQENTEKIENSEDLSNPLFTDQNKKPKKKIKIHKINVWSLFKYPSITSVFILLNFLWIGTRATFNGICISSKSFPGNFYVNIIILYIIESIAYCVTGFLIEIKKLGRRGSLWILYILCILTLIPLAFLDLSTVPTLALNYISRFCLAGIEVIYYTYSLELYPTPVRSVAFGINATFGNGGSILAPMLYEFLPNWFFLILIAVVCGLNAFILVFLPETVGKPMVETIKELENEKYEENDENENNEEENNNVKAEKEE